MGFIFLSVIIGIVFFSYFVRSKKQMVLFEAQALKRNGRLSAGFYIMPQLFFSVGSYEMKVISTPGGRNSPPYTRMQLKYQTTRNHNIKVAPENIFSKIGKSFVGQDIQMQNPQFDESFLIKGSDDIVVRSILTSQVQQRLLDIEKLNPVIEVKKNMFQFYVPRQIKEEKELDRFIETGILIFYKLESLG